MAHTHMIFDMESPDDVASLRQVLSAPSYQAALSELDEWLRQKLKYSELEEPVAEALEQARTKLHDLLEYHSIDLG